MNGVAFVINGEPIAKKRHRFVKKTGHTYDEQAAEKKRFLWEAKTKICGAFLDGAISATLVFVMPRPASHYGTGKNIGLLKKSAPEYPTVKPDNDNLQKFVFDCLNGVLYKDDSQVVSVNSSKRYVAEGEEPGTVISLVEVEYLK